jgi:hypothetical protein
MNKDEAKFLLRAFRPKSPDAQDPLFAEPLKAAQNDPELCAWLKSEEAFDATIAQKLRETQPPEGLEEAILAGVRASQLHRPRRTVSPWWIGLAVAACLALAAVTTYQLSHHGRPGAQQFAAMAMNDLENFHFQHEGNPPKLAPLLAEFASTPLPLPAHLKVNLDQLAKDHCRMVNFAGWQGYEICFQREGVWFHLYAGHADGLKSIADAHAAGSNVFSKGKLSATTWRDGNVAYALVTRSDLLPPVLATISVQL